MPSRSKIISRPMGRAIKQNIVSFGSDKTKKTGKDASYDPFYTWVRRASRSDDIFNRIGFLTPAMFMVHPVELYAASFTPKGAFITRIFPRMAFRSGWIFVPKKKSKVPLEEKLRTRLIELTKQYNIKNVIVSAVTIDQIFGRALIYKREVSIPGQAKQYNLFVSRLPEEWIVYKPGTNDVDYYFIEVGYGLGTKSLKIDPKDAVLLITDVDPLGNGLQGIPAILPAYRTIYRMENIEESYTQLITLRGMGLVDIEIQGITNEKELDRYGEQYGDPSSYATIIHNERMKIETKEGIRASFSLDETINSQTKQIASATGHPKLRMEGEAHGTVTGGEADQDNQGENYQSIQERSEPYILKVYQLVDSGLIGKDFELDFPIDLKMDRMKETQIFATESSSIMTVPDLLSVDEGRDRLGYPGMENKEDGKRSISDFINSKITEQNEEEGNPENEETVVRKPDLPSNQWKAVKTPAQQNQNPTTPEPVEKRDWAERYDRERFFIDSSAGLDFESMEDKNLQSVIDSFVKLHGDNKTPSGMDVDEVIGTVLKRFKLTKNDKDRVATMLADKVSYTKMNNILSDVFGSGKSPNWIAGQRNNKKD